MFEDIKAKIAKFEAEHESVQKAHQHFKTHGKTYLVTGGAFGAGYILKGRIGPDVIQTFTNSTDNVATVINRSKNVDVVIQYLNQRGYVANPVECVETLERWGSQAEAAMAKGISETNLSQHLNGKYPHVNGLHFIRV